MPVRSRSEYILTCREHIDVRQNRAVHMAAAERPLREAPPPILSYGISGRSLATAQVHGGMDAVDPLLELARADARIVELAIP